ncbi:hypothetical protein JOQ06_017076 [Pogonophryne albipinna]|uniref:RING-type domain-containing protein n=1 Tax=Pogonophryne albipinna TaxID=1090488 RepID=A0AAD6B1K0_9TELE|nr:hypothetical protein JOQ06_017076 [Pogonophryne albipinna]
MFAAEGREIATEPVAMPGFDYKFLEKPKRRFQCPLCSKAMREPVQVSTCGHRFCDTCLQEFLSWGFVSQWVSVCEWEQCHGWLMNDCVFITIPGPLSPQRDIQSPLQVSEGCDGILGPDPESFGGVLCCPILSLTTTMVSELHTQRDVVFSCVKALRPPLCTLRSVKASQSCALRRLS